jgi:restriction system protein
LARKKTSLAEDLMDLVSLLPWWAGVVLAVTSYVLLHRLATHPTAVALQPGQVGELMVRSVGAALAGFGQYVVPLICLSGAGVSAWRRHRRRTLISNTAQAKGADALDGMSWREFEMLVGEAFRLQGFGVSETGGGGPDGGVDLVLSKGTEKFFVQCKQWKAYKVGVDVVRELYGVMAAKGATGGFVVTSGSFSEDAKAFADGRNVKLLDGHRLFGLIRQARQSLSSSVDAADRLRSVAPPSAPGVAASGAACPAVARGWSSALPRRARMLAGSFGDVRSIRRAGVSGR